MAFRRMMQGTRHTDIEMQLDTLSREARPGTFQLKVRQLARRLVVSGFSREELLDIFEQYREVLRQRGQEDQEDDLLDVMDQLAGWSAEHARI
jgi:hemerythrin superfamily protein